jgi:alkylhydroperoxidase family enzyme
MSQGQPKQPRISPAEPPYAPDVQARFDKIMPPGVPPLMLFRVMAQDKRLYERLAGGSLLDAGHLTLRQRELVIDRVTARCGSEYEWGVHVAFFGAKAGLGEAELASIVHGAPSDPCWTPEDRVVLEIVDSLDARSDIDDALWERAREHLREAAIMEIMMLAGFYRTISYLTVGLRLPLEPYAARFPKA